MTLAWLFTAAAALLVPLGRPGVPRLAALSRAGRVAERTDAPVAIARSWAPIGGVGLTLALALLAGPVLGLSAACALGTAIRQLSGLRTRRRARAADGAARDVIRLVLAEVEAGAPLAEAVVAAASGSLEEDLTRLADELRGGRDPTALQVSPRLQPLLHACRVSLGSGAALAPVLAAVAAQLDADLERAAAVDAELAGVCSSAALLAVLPAVGLAMGLGLGVDPVRVLRAPAGQLLVLVGVALESAGLLWTARLAAAVEPR
ncbi:type II secretion system F family protein [Jatrophihabitans sp.]|uniref:type II secretion system F family protein n=1 Tax=Jatrophihabitans sp. TaxID=1932789 RepID=UPI0030C67FD1|nr:secretion protein [Jatrophihabitans sp.]